MDVNADEIAKAVADGMRLSDEERAAMGTRGRELVAAKYQWDTVGRAMVGVYETLTERQGGGGRLKPTLRDEVGQALACRSGALRTPEDNVYIRTFSPAAVRVS